jgi:hypothetical protein
VLLQDPDPSVVSATCLALADLGKVAKPFAIPALNRLVQTGSEKVRPVALTALTRLTTDAVAQPPKRGKNSPASR